MAALYLFYGDASILHALAHVLYSLARSCQHATRRAHARCETHISFQESGGFCGRQRLRFNQPAQPARRSVAKPNIKFRQRVRGVFLIFEGKIFTVSADLSAAHLERLRIAHVARTQDL